MHQFTSPYLQLLELCPAREFLWESAAFSRGPEVARQGWTFLEQLQHSTLECRQVCSVYCAIISILCTVYRCALCRCSGTVLSACSSGISGVWPRRKAPGRVSPRTKLLLLLPKFLLGELLELSHLAEVSTSALFCQTDKQTELGFMTCNDIISRQYLLSVSSVTQTFPTCVLNFITFELNLVSLQLEVRLLLTIL